MDSANAGSLRPRRCPRCEKMTRSHGFCEHCGAGLVAESWEIADAVKRLREQHPPERPAGLRWFFITLASVLQFLPNFFRRASRASRWFRVVAVMPFMGAFAACTFLYALLMPALVKALYPTLAPPRELCDMLEELAAKAGTKMPPVRIVDMGEKSKANAFFCGLLPGLSGIFLTTKLAESFPDEEIRAVVAHELGHARLRHVPIHLGLSLAVLAGTWFLCELSTGSVVMLAALLLFLVGIPFMSAAARSWEKQADLFSARLTGTPLALSDAILRLHRRNGMPMRRPVIDRLYQHHPDGDDRVRYLHAFAAKERHHR